MVHVLFFGGQTLTFITVFGSSQHSLGGAWDPKTLSLTLMTFFFSFSISVPSFVNFQDDMKDMYDKVINMHSSKINGRHITFVSLISKQIYEEQLKLKKEEIIEKESLYIQGSCFLTRFFLVLMIMLFFGLVLIC